MVAVVVMVSWAIVATMIPRASAIHVPSVSATIFNVEGGSTKVEVVAVRIASIDAEVPVASVPVERTIEVGGITESAILP